MNDLNLITDESIKQRILSIQVDSVFGKNLYNYYEFISWARWLNKFNELYIATPNSDVRIKNLVNLEI